MKRIIWHWTAGTHTPNAVDLKAYHKVIDGDGKVIDGHFPIEANEVIVKGKYAAHTLNMNTGSIGLSVAAMVGAKESPFYAGQHPITRAQVDALVALTASLCRAYNIPVTRQTVLSHAEVQGTLGVVQKNKWDITWLPGMQKPGDAHVIGDNLRARVAERLRPVDEVSVPVTPTQSWFAALFGGIMSLIERFKR